MRFEEKTTSLGLKTEIVLELEIFNHNVFSRERFKSSFKEVGNLREGQEDADVLGKSTLFASVVLKM